MKKNLLTLTLLFISLVGAKAQIAAGTKLIGGNFSYHYSNQNHINPTYTQEASDTFINVIPRIGYFIAPNIAIGLEGNMTYYKSSNETSKQSNFNYGGGPFARYYKFFGEQFGLTLTTFTGFIQNKLVEPNISRTRSIYAQLVPGIVYLPNPKFGIEASMGNIGYSHVTTYSKHSSERWKTNSFGANFGFNQYTIGASFYL